ncbi:MAG: M28 family peptidase [Anaerolineales bacterium]|nr:M28 family peptidase [Anaerolineales bacterium]MCB8954301.1 M28 family peptidase [Ardenticatenales bacterium]
MRRYTSHFASLLLLLTFWLWLTGCSRAPETALPAEPVAGQLAQMPASATLTPAPTPAPRLFDGRRAHQFAAAQLSLGPRWPGSDGHRQVRALLVDTLTQANWQVETQDFDYQGFAAQNIIARANVGHGPVVIIGAHYDTRRIADQTPGSSAPVPGAVDGASGVAVLLELAQALNLPQVPYEVWLAFFDVEDNGHGGIAGWDWIAGSRYMADNLTVSPAGIIVLDMIGDADQQLYYEGNSDDALRAEIWAIAADLDYGDFFIPAVRHTMIDDHLPFAQRGWAAVDIIDFDYPYWHTVDDTLDKISPDSLERVGRTVQTWLEQP